LPNTSLATRQIFSGADGFSDISALVVVRPDIDGRLLPMIKNMAGYARTSEKIKHADIDKVLTTIEQAVMEGSYLGLAPQFVVTATR